VVGHDEDVLVVLHVCVGVLVRLEQLKGAVEDLHRAAHVQGRVVINLLRGRG